VYFIFLIDGGASQMSQGRGSLPPLPHPLNGPVYISVKCTSFTNSFEFVVDMRSLLF